MARIVIVDDDVESAGHLAKFLNQAGHDVTTKSHIDGLIEEFVREKPDLLILDVMFPDNPVAGFDLARAVRQRKEIRTTPIILLTGVNSEFLMNFSIKDIDPEWLPIQDFEEKPVVKAKLLKKINTLLQGSARK